MTDIASVSLERPIAELADDLSRSFAEYGFAIVRDHGIPKELIASAEEKSRAFFALPEDVKMQYHLKGQGGARGYTPFGIERAKDAQVHDLKEFWHVGRSLPHGHPLESMMQPNVWPHEVIGFRETFETLYAAFEQTGLRILSAIALHLDLPEHFFDPTVEDGNSVMRLLHYPPVPHEAEGRIRAAAHEDINTITLLLGAEEAGLELKTKDGRWIPVVSRPGELVINIGDMLQRLTNGVLRSTSHRVVNPAPDRASHARYSMPFFLHFRPDFVIEALPGTVPAGEEPKWPPISSHEYLQERLREIKLK